METRNGPACGLCQPPMGVPGQHPLSCLPRAGSLGAGAPSCGGKGRQDMGKGQRTSAGRSCESPNSLESPNQGRPRLAFLEVCPRRARNTAHNSSLGGRSCPDSCRGSRGYEWLRLPRSPGGRGARGGPEAQGLAGTMARPGPAVAEAGAAADGEGWGTGAKLGTKGLFSRPAGGCLHRCGSGGAARPRAGGRGTASAACRAWGRPRRQGGQPQGRAPLISRASGDHPHTSSWLWAACPPMGLSPGLGPSTRHWQAAHGGAEPSRLNLLGAAAPGPRGLTDARTGAGTGPELGQHVLPFLEQPGTPGASRKDTDSPTSGPPRVLGLAGVRHKHGGAWAGLGATARLPNAPVRLGWAPFQEEGGEPQERARPTFSGREKTGGRPGWGLPWL